VVSGKQVLEDFAVTIVASVGEHRAEFDAEVFSWSEMPDLLSADDLFEPAAASGTAMAGAVASTVIAEPRDDRAPIVAADEDDFEDDEFDDDEDDEEEEDDDEEDEDEDDGEEWEEVDDEEDDEDEEESDDDSDEDEDDDEDWEDDDEDWEDDDEEDEDEDDDED